MRYMAIWPLSLRHQRLTHPGQENAEQDDNVRPTHVQLAALCAVAIFVGLVGTLATFESTLQATTFFRAISSPCSAHEMVPLSLEFGAVECSKLALFHEGEEDNGIGLSPKLTQIIATIVTIRETFPKLGQNPYAEVGQETNGICHLQRPTPPRCLPIALVIGGFIKVMRITAMSVSIRSLNCQPQA